MVRTMEKLDSETPKSDFPNGHGQSEACFYNDATTY